ncbi:hypothetical protein [Flagellimonas meishanensis]|uniref:hypothetical protein n=1 Tax=Flagellimonas meishanensis TaxID=2873264 RepID=UPI001CA63096|nr:hypothetical protein [[Muricauda] meishanensis]
MQRSVYILVGLALLIWSCEDILEVPDISDQTVPILAPTEGSVLTTNAVGFDWETVEDATAYNIQIATPDFENAVQLVLDSVVAVDSLGNVATRIDQNLFNGNYQWRIKAFNSGFETGYTVNSFQVNGDDDLDLVAPNTPQLVSPANASSQAETQVSFVWTREDISGTAERDSIFIFLDEALQNLAIKGLGANKTYSTELTEGTYYWFVRAYDAAGNESEASTPFNLNITN